MLYSCILPLFLHRTSPLRLASRSVRRQHPVGPGLVDVVVAEVARAVAVVRTGKHCWVTSYL